MKYLNLLRYPAKLLAALLLSSCASSPEGSHARFREQAACDAIVRFSSWELITVNKPDTRENGFLPLFHLADAEKVLTRNDFPHGLAVVICNSFLSVGQEADLQKKWAAIFGKAGYQRVVFLRGAFHDQVNGLDVIRDVPLVAAQFTAVSSPATEQRETR